ncbi:MAG TPA: hypothetical protein VFX56_00560 [Nitrospira sp.]|nr:hypothetical protein [Nitrospira sp.]
MWSKNITKRIRSRFAMMAFVGLSALTPLGCNNPETILVIEKPTEVRGIILSSSQDPSTNVQPGNVIATLQAGDTARAVGVYHGEGRDGFKVKLANGTEGLIFASDTFTVTSR